MNIRKTPKQIKVLLLIIMALATVCATFVVLYERGFIPKNCADQFSATSDSFQSDNSGSVSATTSGSDAVSSTDTEVDLPAPVPEIVPLSDEAQKGINVIFEKYDLVSLQIAVIDDGYVTNTYSDGYANSEKKQPINDDTKVRIASMSKVFVAMLAMHADENGALDVDGSLSDQLGYRVRNPYYTRHTLTLRDLLTHTATIKDNASISGRSLQNFLQAKSTYVGGFCPGTEEAWAYSNAGFRAAGGVVEVLTGTTIPKYSQEHFFEPLGIDASFFAQLLEDQSNIATLYHCNGSVANSVQEQLNRKYFDTPAGNCTVFAGGLTISAKDFARLMCILLRDGEYDGVQYLSADTVADMETVRYELENMDQCTALRHKDNLYGRELYYHTGVAYGVLSFSAYDPIANEGFVITTVGSNRDSRDENNIPVVCAEFATYILNEVLDGKAS